METILDDATRVAVIGMGTMGTAMASRLQQSTDYNVSEIRRGDDLNVLEQQDITVVAMKPYQWGEAVEGIRAHVKSHGVLVWIMAGITVRRMRDDLCSDEVSLVRAMPTIAVDGHSLTALYSEGAALTVEQNTQIETMFAQFGEYIWLADENLFAEYTALVGSGVGFFGEFAETFRQIAIEKGFSAEQADQMARGALGGAAHMISAGHSAAELVTRVTSAKGTTEAGLRVLRRKGFHRMMRAVINAAAARSRQLAKS